MSLRRIEQGAGPVGANRQPPLDRPAQLTSTPQVRAFPPIVSGLLVLFAIAQPVLGLANRIVVQMEIRPDTPRSFRQNFWVKPDELTPWGRKAQRAFRLYWLGLGILFLALIVITSLS